MSSRLNTIQHERTKSELEDFRCMVENKLKEKKGNVATVQNIVMVVEEEERAEKVNTKRWESFKKSREQVKRFKKPLREGTLKGSLKFRSINPECTFSTLSPF